MDSLYPFIWDVTMLEFIIQLHHKRGETQRKTVAVSSTLRSSVHSGTNLINVTVEGHRHARTQRQQQRRNSSRSSGSTKGSVLALSGKTVCLKIHLKTITRSSILDYILNSYIQFISYLSNTSMLPCPT